MGVGAAIAGAVEAISTAFAGFGASIAAGVGLGDATLAGFTAGGLIGTGLEGATVGALGGGALSAVEGKPILPGALEGAGVAGATAVGGPVLGSELGIGAVGGGILAGAGAGALGAEATGGNPLTGALISGAEGGLNGAISSGPQLAGAAGGGTAVGGPGASAGGIAAPASIGADLPLEGATAGGATLDAVSGLQGPTASGQPLGSALGGASLDGATAGFDVPGGGTPLAAQDSAALGQQLASGQSGDVTDQALSISGNSGPGGVQTITGLGQEATPATQSANGALTNPELGGATGFSPGGAPESAPSSQGFLGNLTSPNISGAPANAALNIGATNGAAAPAGNSIGNFVDNPSLGTLGTAVSNNSALLLGGAALGYDAIRANSPPAGLSNISTEANQLSAQATQLQSYLQNGTLPPGVSTSLHQAGQQAAATIRSQYAARGMSGSSAEAADLANVQNTIVSQGANIATQLLQTGISEAGLSSQLYEAIMNESIQSDQQLGTALATLASATARPSITLKAA